MKLSEIPEIQTLSKAEKILLLEDLWDNISADDSDIPVPESHLLSLQKRYDKYRDNPADTVTFEKLQKNINARK